MFMHVPGLKVVMPSTPYDAKGLLIAAVHDGNPVLYIDDRWLYADTGDVPQEIYSVPIGRAAVRREGNDVTIVATSYLATESVKAVEILAERGVDAELIDLRSIKPWDCEQICASVRKTGRLVVADAAWGSCGVAAEIAATVAAQAFYHLKAPITRVTLPDLPAPASAALENAYYPDAMNIVVAVENLLAIKKEKL
jgi:pyruvate dehydrogenase E1 component beta subunit